MASTGFTGKLPSIVVSTSYRIVNGTVYQVHFQNGQGAWSWQPPNYAAATGWIDSITVGGYTIDGSAITGDIFFFIAVLGGVY